MKYEEIIKNKRLTDFEETKESVIENQITHMPENDKHKKGLNKGLWNY